jgi:HTH-type transcriptional regulator, sugar sensing transcriptional regulator
MLEKNLEKAGLSPKEVKIYLAGLKAGPVLASFLARKTGINRPNVYDNLKLLAKKGLVSTTGGKYSQRFVMEDPVNLERYLERKKKEVDKMKGFLKMAIPEVEVVINEKAGAPNVKFIDGEEGLKNAVLDSLKTENEEILAVVATQEFFGTLGIDFTKYYVEQRIKNNIKTKTIRVKSHEDYEEKYFHEHEEQLRDMRYAPENISFSESYFIYNNIVVYLSSQKENFGLVVESAEHAEMMRNMFGVLWEASRG